MTERCSFCGGTGRVPGPDGEMVRVVCWSCGGTGWVDWTPVAAQPDLMFPLLDTQESKRAADEAVERVSATPQWWAEAYEAAERVARRMAAFTTDDVWEELGRKPAEPRAMGAVMRTMARNGLIEPTATYRATAQVSRHHAPIRVWRSRVR